MIIGFVGFIGSGKDTAADYLVNFHEFRRDSFANTLKDAVSAVFGWDRVLLEGRTKEARDWREQKDEWWSQRLGMNITPRLVLQYWGTEVCRNGFHPDIWVASVENKLRQTKDNIVITDCRFANEVNAIKNAGGSTVRIQRGEKPEWFQSAIDFNKGPDGNAAWSLSKANLDKLKVHASEYSSVGVDYDFYLDNNGTIDDLHKQIESIINF